MYTEAT